MLQTPFPPAEIYRRIAQVANKNGGFSYVNVVRLVFQGQDLRDANGFPDEASKGEVD